MCKYTGSRFIALPNIAVAARLFYAHFKDLWDPEYVSEAQVVAALQSTPRQNIESCPRCIYPTLVVFLTVL